MFRNKKLSRTEPIVEKIIFSLKTEETRLPEILPLLKLLENLNFSYETIITGLICILEKNEFTDKQCQPAILSSIRRIIPKAEVDTCLDTSKIFDRIWQLIELEKISSISTLLSLFTSLNKHYSSKKSAILDEIKNCLVSNNAGVRKETQNFVYQLLEAKSDILSNMEPPIWRAFLSSAIILEENQQHIIHAHIPEFLALVRNQACLSDWALILYERGFGHENKKVMRLFAFIALENLEKLDFTGSQFLTRSFLPTITNMLLYDIISENHPSEPRMVESLRKFCSANDNILEMLFMALSDRFMSGPPLLYILTALSEKWKNPPNETVYKGWVQNYKIIFRILLS